MTPRLWQKIAASIHPYEPFLLEVEKPARYVGGEFNRMEKAYQPGMLRMALAFPDTYEIGMSYLGYQILYNLLNEHPDIIAERAYTPWVDMEQKLRSAGLPVVSQESATPLGDFDVIGFSLQYEMNYTNILTMLDLCHIPWRAEQRPAEAPLIIAGGPCATHPEPLAPFFDLFIIGDGEESLLQLLLRYRELKQAGYDKGASLLELAKMPGVYCPRIHPVKNDPLTGQTVVMAVSQPEESAAIERVWVRDISEFPFPTRPVVASLEAVFNRCALEIARGCGEGCRFCQAGYIYRPVRERRPQDVVETALAILQNCGYDEVSLSSLSTADYSLITPLVQVLTGILDSHHISLSVSSLRAYGLAEELLSLIASIRNTTLTFAPEAGSQRMRDILSKKVTEAEMLRSAELAYRHGWDRIKLYFMLGLPGEQVEDLDGIVDISRRILDIGRRYHKRRAGLTVSVSCFVPKPHTPFQWSAINSVEEIERKQRYLKSGLTSSGLEFKWHDSKTSLIEGIIARGDRRLADVIEYAWQHGARMDSWSDTFRYEIWAEALAHTGHDIAASTKEIPREAQLAWDHIRVGVEKDFLRREWEKSQTAQPSAGCPFLGKTPENPVNCGRCGLKCDLAERALKVEQNISILADIRKNTTQAATSPRPKSAVPVYIYRLKYTKLAEAIYISHLDLIRTLSRTLSRTGQKLKYSEGFHPKPDLSYGPALTLGQASVGELIDCKLLEPVNPEEFRDRFNAVASAGFECLEVRAIPVGSSSLGKLICAADYLAFVPGGDKRLSELTELVPQILARGEIRLEKSGKRGAKEIEIRGDILQLELATTTPDRLGPDQPGCWLKMRLKTGIERSLNPRDLLLIPELQALAVSKIVRLGFVDAQGNEIV